MAMGLTPSNIIPARRGYVPYASASDFWPNLGFVFTSLNFLLSSFGFGALELLNVFLSVSSPCEVLWDGREPRWPMARAKNSLGKSETREQGQSLGLCLLVLLSLRTRDVCESGLGDSMVRVN